MFMTIKICPCCKEEKELNPINFKYKQGRAVYCRPCYKQKEREREKRKAIRLGITKKPYRRLSDKERKDKKKLKELRRKKKCQCYVREILINSKCMDCGYDNWLALEFDHRDPSLKTKQITDMICSGASLTTLQKEIDKCDIVCCNCHRIRTQNSFGSWRLCIEDIQ